MSNLVRISEAASLALHTMALLAREHEDRFTNRAISEKLGASGHHLAKVMPRLVKAGLVHSLRGPSGGFRLGLPPEEVRLVEIYEAVEGPIGEGQCLLGRPICSGKNCALGALMRRIHQQVRDYLAETTLAEVASKLTSIDNSLEDAADGPLRGRSHAAVG